ncbi:MAG: NAD(P)-dependent oxidoreductase [Chloroflexota bacterium]|jgi:3-hydroxyisobutyrate dehydrogenase-like beta-hydroxyacid dehydrogenase|nr:NAD(P)-dependent oxidoreductase [Chloroflexota bacterium]MDP6508486.1 NAD(P)-dependent oxidoreductase [Chloroflexota bacterium]MDP6757575.1 NAD(P)-dependent oxidoreductase [Chloroflexota bacterium]
MAGKKVGFIGVGIMGGGMVRNVLKGGFDVKVFDMNPDAVAEIVAEGATAATSAADAADGADFIQVVVPGPRDVEAVVFGDSGVAETARAEAIVIQHATIDPSTMQNVAAGLAEKGVKTLDAPLLRTPMHAASGNLGFPVGGDKETLEEARELLMTVGDTIYETGKIGTGSALKLVNNMLNITILCAACEAVTLGVKSGLKLDMMLEAFYHTPARARHFEMIPGTWESRDFTPGFMTLLGHKDIRLAVQHAADVSVPVNVSSAAYSLMAMTEGQGFGRDSFTSVQKLIEAAAGVEVQSESGTILGEHRD